MSIEREYEIVLNRSPKAASASSCPSSRIPTGPASNVHLFPEPPVSLVEKSSVA